MKPHQDVLHFINVKITIVQIAFHCGKPHAKSLKKLLKKCTKYIIVRCVVLNKSKIMYTIISLTTVLANFENFENCMPVLSVPRSQKLEIYVLFSFPDLYHLILNTGLENDEKYFTNHKTTRVVTHVTTEVTTCSI